LERKLGSLKKYEKVISNNLKALDQCSNADRSSFNTSLRPRNSHLLLEEPGGEGVEDKQEVAAFSPISCF
jgi:hypothetical protein